MHRLLGALLIVASTLVACGSSSSGSAPVASSSDGGEDAGKGVVGNTSDAGFEGDTGADGASEADPTNDPACPATWSQSTAGTACPRVGLVCRYDLDAKGEPLDSLFCVGDGGLAADAGPDAGAGSWVLGV